MLDEVKRESVEWLAQLETIADDSILSTRAELMQKFKDGKSGEWYPDYWICLAHSKDVEVTEEGHAMLVNMDHVVQGRMRILLLLLS